MGVEPTTVGTTIRRSNQLGYAHHIRPFRVQSYGEYLRYANFFAIFFEGGSFHSPTILKGEGFFGVVGEETVEVLDGDFDFDDAA